MNIFQETYSEKKHTLKKGVKAYHLGNVLAVVSDKKFAIDNGAGSITGYTAEILAAYRYYPGGSLMDAYNPTAYKFGYNAGSERDDEITGTVGTHFTTYFREFNGSRTKVGE